MKKIIAILYLVLFPVLLSAQDRIKFVYVDTINSKHLTRLDLIKKNVITPDPRFGDNQSEEASLDYDYFVAAKIMRDIATLSDSYAGPVSKSHIKACNARVKQAWEDEDNCEMDRIFSYFKNILSKCDVKLDEKDSILIANVANEAYGVRTLMKNDFKRQRPWFNFWYGASYQDVRDNCILMYQKDWYKSKNLRNRCDPTNYSYPSGHSIVVYAVAMVLADVYGEGYKGEAIKDSLLAAAHQNAYSRVILGMHHFSDIMTALKLANSTYHMIVETDAFKNDAKKIKYSWTSKIKNFAPSSFEKFDEECFKYAISTTALKNLESGSAIELEQANIDIVNCNTKRLYTIDWRQYFVRDDYILLMPKFLPILK